MVVRGTGIVVIAAILAALAGCATTTTMRANLSNSAQNLEYNAAALMHDTGTVLRSDDDTVRSDEDATYDSRYPDRHYAHEYTRDARALARSAHDLRLAVDQGDSDSAVRAAFERVSRSYHAVRDEIAHSDSLQARRDFGPVTDSYRAIEHDLGIHADHGEYLPPPA